MKSALIIGGVVVGLIALIIVIGALSPRDHVASVTAKIAAPPNAVWSAIVQPEAFPTWRGDVRRVEMLTSTATGPSWREYTRNGTLTMGIEQSDPPRRVVTRILDEHLPYGGVWEYDIAPDGSNESRVTITERGWVSNPLFRFVSRFVMGQTSTMDTYLRALGKHFGAEPTPTVVSSGARHGI
jgi:uncharacterized protein YndB with AHSA1/START domain